MPPRAEVIQTTHGRLISDLTAVDQPCPGLCAPLRQHASRSIRKGRLPLLAFPSCTYYPTVCPLCPRFRCCKLPQADTRTATCLTSRRGHKRFDVDRPSLHCTPRALYPPHPSFLASQLASFRPNAQSSAARGATCAIPRRLIGPTPASPPHHAAP